MTGVQTCALPIYDAGKRRIETLRVKNRRNGEATGARVIFCRIAPFSSGSRTFVRVTVGDKAHCDKILRYAKCYRKP